MMKGTNITDNFILKIARAAGKAVAFLNKDSLSGKDKMEKPVSDDKKVIRVNLLPIVRHFEGCLNPLNNIIQNKDTSDAAILFDNLFQIADGHGDEVIAKWKDEFFEGRESWTSSVFERKASEIMTLLLQCGVVLVEDTDRVWNNGKRACYRMLSDIDEGQEYCILEPYWTLNNEVFEKGLVK